MPEVAESTLCFRILSTWILRLRLKAPRRMTALLEGSKNQIGMMGGFSPVLVEQIVLT